MFIYNVKINANKVFKFFFIGIVLLLIILVGIICFRLFKGANSFNNHSSCIPQNVVSKLTPNNYSDVLKSVHENIDNYVGLKINFTGYIYRVSDLNENQFILARDMIISSDFKSVVVGFLCEYDNATEFKDGTWVELTGQITKGSYHGDMPIINITQIKKVDKPNEEFVYPPSDDYIPTSSVF